MQYRTPTAADIGKMVEVEIQNDFFEAELLGIAHERTYTRYAYRWPDSDEDEWPEEAYNARIPITTSTDELLVAADLCADHGMDAAAEVLRREAKRVVRLNEIEMGIYEHRS